MPKVGVFDWCTLNHIGIDKVELKKRWYINLDKNVDMESDSAKGVLRPPVGTRLSETLSQEKSLKFREIRKFQR